jgi:hypothetical protein
VKYYRDIRFFFFPVNGKAQSRRRAATSIAAAKDRLKILLGIEGYQIAWASHSRSHHAR